MLECVMFQYSFPKLESFYDQITRATDLNNVQGLTRSLSDPIADVSSLNPMLDHVMRCVGCCDQPTKFDEQITAAHTHDANLMIYTPSQLWGAQGLSSSFRIRRNSFLPDGIKAEARKLIRDSQVAEQFKNKFAPANLEAQKEVIAEICREADSKIHLSELGAEQGASFAGDLYLKAGILLAWTEDPKQLGNFLMVMMNAASYEYNAGRNLRAALIMELGYRILFDAFKNLDKAEMPLQLGFLKHAELTSILWNEASDVLPTLEERAFAAGRSFLFSVLSGSAELLYDSWKSCFDYLEQGDPKIAAIIRDAYPMAVMYILDQEVAMADSVKAGRELSRRYSKLYLEYAETVFAAPQYNIERNFLLGSAIYHANLVRDPSLIADARAVLASEMLAQEVYDESFAQYVRLALPLVRKGKLSQPEHSLLKHAIEGMLESYSKTTKPKRDVSAMIEKMKFLV